MENNNYSIKTATYSFGCPICGTKVSAGDNYVESEGIATCLCVLPGRKLIPLTRIRELEEQVKRIEIEKLRLKIDLDVLVTFPDGTAAKKIVEKYRKISAERVLSSKN